MTAASEFAALQFQDGERNLQLFEPSEGTPNYYQAVFGEKAINFYCMAEDGERPYVPGDPSRVEHRSDCTVLGDVTYELYVMPEDDDRWWWYGYSTSTVTNLNDVARSQLQPRGAHSFPIELRDGDDEDGLFSTRTMTEAIADGVFIFATSARQYLHDSKSHGRGVISLESDTAAMLQTICQLAHMEIVQYPQVKHFIDSIISAYDLATFYPFHDPTMARSFDQLAPTRRDPLLSEIIHQAKLNRLLSNDFMAKLVQTVDAGPFTVRMNRGEVRRYSRIVNYYDSISELVT